MRTRGCNTISQRSSRKDNWDSDRLMMVKVSAECVDIVLIQVYMPTTKYEDEEAEQIYVQIEDIIRGQKGNTNVIVMEDFNAKVFFQNVRERPSRSGL